MGFNAEGRPQNLCAPCYEKLGKPETYSSYYPSWCHCGRYVCPAGTFCFLCGKCLNRCTWCGKKKGSTIDGIYSLKDKLI